MNVRMVNITLVGIVSVCCLFSSVAIAQMKQEERSVFKADERYDIQYSSGADVAMALENCRVLDVKVIAGQQFLLVAQQAYGQSSECLVALDAIRAILPQGTAVRIISSQRETQTIQTVIPRFDGQYSK